MTHDRGRWAKLPRWVVRELESFERSVKYLLARVAELESGDDTTGVRARSGSSLTWYPLPKDQTYEFDMNLGAIQIHVREEHDGVWLAISAVNYELDVAPRASNLIYVRTVER